MVKIVNTTPHPINFLTSAGEEVEIPCHPENVISAQPVETLVEEKGDVKFVKTVFQSSPEGEEILSRLEREYPGAIIVGSIIAAQAYPGRVVAMTPAPGFERVPPAQKKMAMEKFTIF